MKEQLIELKEKLLKLSNKKAIPYILVVSMIASYAAVDKDFVVNANTLDDEQDPDFSYETIIGEEENEDYLLHEENSIQVIEGTMEEVSPGSGIKDVVTRKYTEQRVISKEEKINWILGEYNINRYQFNVLCAMVLHEAKANNYTDSYAVISTMYNRTVTKKWIDYINSVMGRGCGYNIYCQAIAPGQYVPYNQYKGLIPKINNTVAEQATIDMLYSKQPNHPYTSFRSAGSPSKGRVQLVPGGNRYFSLVQKDDNYVVALETEQNGNYYDININEDYQVDSYIRTRQS